MIIKNLTLIIILLNVCIVYKKMIYLNSYLKPKVMIKKFLSIAFLGILLVACKENNTESVQSEEVTPVETTIPAETPATETTQTPADTTAPVQVQAQTQQTTNSGPFTQQQQAAPTTGQTAPGWSGKPNPPHGQEGHRCDIQVGAILP